MQEQQDLQSLVSIPGNAQQAEPPQIRGLISSKREVLSEGLELPRFVRMSRYLDGPTGQNKGVLCMMQILCPETTQASLEIIHIL